MGTDSSGLPWCEPGTQDHEVLAFSFQLAEGSDLASFSMLLSAFGGPGRRKGKSIPYKDLFAGRVVTHKVELTFGNYYSRKVIRNHGKGVSPGCYAIIVGTDSSKFRRRSRSVAKARRGNPST